MKMNRKIVIAYTALLSIGGIAGFIAAKSLLSLVMSGSVAALLIASLYLNVKTPRLSRAMTYSLIGSMALFFAFRFMTTHKIFPGLFFAILSCAVLIALYFIPSQEQALKEHSDQKI